MVDVRWAPGWRQLAIPCVVHGIGLAGLVLAGSWLPFAPWLTPAVVASAGIDVLRAFRSIGRPVVFRVTERGITVEEDFVWREMALEEAWLGPGLIALRMRNGRRTLRWWLYRGETSSADEAYVRRTLRASVPGDPLSTGFA